MFVQVKHKVSEEHVRQLFVHSLHNKALSFVVFGRVVSKYY